MFTRDEAIYDFRKYQFERSINGIAKRKLSTIVPMKQAKAYKFVKCFDEMIFVYSSNWLDTFKSLTYLVEKVGEM